MANISSATNEKVISVKQFLGLNENVDGDNKLKIGEASVCRNFKITDNGNLKKRAGTVLKYTLGTDKPVVGMWQGMCTHHELFIAACDGHLWMLQDDDFFKYPTDMGSLSTANDVFMFGFDEKVFVMDGTNYHEVWYEVKESAASATITAELGDESTIDNEAVDVDVFKTMVDSGGTYEFWYGENGWTIGFQTVIDDIGEYGITYDGDPEVGDKLTVEYTAASHGLWHLSNLTDSTAANYLAPYVPLVAIAIPPKPAGGGELQEQVNKLTPARRVWISTDGVGDTFQLPETDLDSIDYVLDLSSNSPLTPVTDYTVDAADGTVTFTSVPALATNGYEIGYTAKVTYASTVGAMRYAETFSGANDIRVFIYGDGSNRAFYSELDYPNGHPRGDYFPDLNEVTVGDTNTPITSVIRHYSRLLAFKPNQTFSIDYGVVTLPDGLMTMAFYTTPINRILGNEPMGQVQMVLNAPITLCEGNLYEWRSGSSYAANLSVDERQAKRISDRISATLRGMKNVHCYDDNLNSEYYIIDDNGNCLVHNYRADAWYFYTGLNARLVTAIDGVLWIGTHDGKILKMDDTKLSDQGKAIDCYWESGSLDFGVSNMRKYVSQLWVSLKAEPHNKVTVTSKTDRSIENAEVEVEPEYENFMPKTTRCKIKSKKFVYYKLCFTTNDASTTATVVDTEIKVRYTAQAK